MSNPREIVRARMAHSDSDFSELKRRLKAEQKAKEKVEKQAKQTTATAAAVTKERAQSPETRDLKEEDISPNVSIY